MDELTALMEGMKDMRKRANTDNDGSDVAGGPYETGVLMVKEDAQAHISIIEALPDDLRNRLVSVTLDPDGRISLYFSEVDNGNDKQ